MMKSLYFLVAMSFATFSCGKSDNSSESPEFQGNRYVEKDISGLTISDSSMSGSGLIGLESPMGTVSSARKILTGFELEDEGSITLRTYANENLELGLDIAFTRKGSELVAQFEHDGQVVRLVDGSEEPVQGLHNIDASGEIFLQVDVHNNESPAHIIIWQAGFDEKASAENIVFNSEDTDEVDTEAPGNGKGHFLGIGFNRAALKYIQLSEASDEADIGEAETHDHD